MKAVHGLRIAGSAGLALLAAVVALAAVAGAAGGRTHSTLAVAKGQSIQSAIDRARPGDTIVVAPGVYHENLTITTSGITLRGAGATPGGTVLEPVATPHPSICTEFGEVNGICVTGYVDPQTREPGTPIRDVSVSGFLVRHFSRYGILLYNASDLTVARNETSFNRRYGISGYDLSGVRYVENSAHDNVGGGLQIGDSPNADAVVTGNRIFRNAGEGGIGLFLRDTSHGVVRDNQVERNCAGIVLIATDAPGVRDWDVRRNEVRDNSLACPPAEEGGPPLSGLGIALLGTSHTVVSGNVVAANRPSEDTPIGGGILLASASELGGGDPVDTTVRENRARGNQPADLVTDGSGEGNHFVRNVCGSSVPDGLCG